MPEETCSKVEKQLRSVAFLLESVTEAGNQPLDGRVAIGFGLVLEHAAEDLARGARRKLKVA